MILSRYIDFTDDMNIATGLSTCGKEQKDQNNLDKTEMLPDNYAAKVTIKTRFFFVRRY